MQLWNGARSPIHSLTCSARLTAYREVIPKKGAFVWIGDYPPGTPQGSLFRAQ
jgi:hypothetical protein